MKDSFFRENWRKAMSMLPSSDFLKGKNSGKGGTGAWVANFDWLLRPDTISKVLEGQYGCLPPKTPSRASSEQQGPSLDGFDEEDYALWVQDQFLANSEDDIYPLRSTNPETQVKFNYRLKNYLNR
jgi:hypothetical protein